MFGQIFTSYILQIIIQQELQKLTKILLKIFFKDINFPVKIVDTQKIEKKNSITNSVFCYKNKKKYLFYESKNSCEKKNILITDSRRRQNSFYYLQTLSMGNIILKIVLKLMVNKVSRLLQRVNTFDSKIMREK